MTGRTTTGREKERKREKEKRKKRGGDTFVTQHEGDGQESKLAAGSTLNGRVDGLESIDEHQGQEDDVLGHLGGGKDGGHPFTKAGGGPGFGHQSEALDGGGLAVDDGLQ